jgi:hypothetical protein
VGEVGHEKNVERFGSEKLRDGCELGGGKEARFGSLDGRSLVAEVLVERGS